MAALEERLRLRLETLRANRERFIADAQRQLVALATAFAHPKGTLVSRLIAATVTAQVKRPDGTISAATVNSVSTGRYRSDYTTAYVGTHVVEWSIDGTAVGAGAYTFNVSDDLV